LAYVIVRLRNLKKKDYKRTGAEMVLLFFSKISLKFNPLKGEGYEEICL
jgi:hypothetical protein